MIFRALALDGGWRIEPESDADHRGFYTRGYCRDRLEERGLDPAVIRCEVIVGGQRGSVHGLYLRQPPGEVTFLRCTEGVVHAVLVDLRPDAETTGQTVALELSRDNRRALYAPAGVAYGFQILRDGAEVFLQQSELPAPEKIDLLPWNDPAHDVSWPLPVPRTVARKLA